MADSCTNLGLMTSKNLTRAEAQARAALVRVAHYDIDLDFTTAPIGSPLQSPVFSSTTTISLTALADGETFLDLRDAEVSRVLIDGTDATDAAAYSSDSGIALQLFAGEHTVVVEAQCRYTNNGQGIHRFRDLGR